MMDTVRANPFLDALLKVYNHQNDSYWVAENEERKVVSGADIPQMLLDKALVFAAQH